MYAKVLFFSRSFFVYVFVLGAVFACTLFAFASKPLPAYAAAGINKQINFQGRLLNSQGATVPDGYYNIEFKIYQDGDGQSVGDTTGSPAGALKWTEDHINNNSQGVQVKNGFMSVQLGAITAFGSSIDWNQDTLWLSMNIGDTNATCTPFSTCTPDGEMVPMKRLSSSPYALNSGQLGGLTSSQFVQIGQGVQGDATNNSSIFINKTGTGNLLELQTGGNSALTVANAGDVTFGASANHTLSVTTAAAGVAGKSLTVAAGNAGTGSAVNGGDLLLQAGAASGTGTTGSVIVRSNAADSTGAFQVQKANNTPVFEVDTTNSNVLVAGSIDTTTATTLTVGASTATTVQIGNTSLSSGTQTINIGTNNTSGGTTNITIGAGGSATGGTTTLQAKGNITLATNGVTRATYDTSNNLYFGNGPTAATPNDFTVQGTGSTTVSTAGGGLTIKGGAGATSSTGSIGGAVTIQGGTSGGSGNTAGGNVLIQGGAPTGTGASGSVIVKSNGSNSSTAFNIQNAGGNNMFTVDTVNSRVGIGLGGAALPNSTLEVGGTLRLSGTATESYVSPGGSSVNTKINIPNFDPGAFGQVLAMGLPSTASSTARVMLLADGRTSAHQPSLAVLSPDEANIVGLSWNGASTTGYLMTTDTTSGGGTVALGVRSGAVSGGSGNSGSLTLQSGNIAGGSGNTTGTVFLLSGDGSGTNASSGNVTIDSGSKTGTGTNGVVNVGITNASNVLLGRAGATVTIQGGTTKLTTLGSTTANAAPVCRDTSTTALIACDANTTGSAFLQNGNSFNATAVLGTVDTNNLQIITNNTTRATFDQSNKLYLGNGTTAASPNNFTVSATGSSTAGTAGANLTVQGGAGASATTGSGGGNILIAGGNAAGTGNNAGGTITLQGGSNTNTGAAGTVLVKNSADSTSAFQVQNASSSKLFTVDSTNKIANLGSGSTQPVPNFKTPTLTTTGGSIANSTTYYYAITATSGAGETEKSPVISYTVVSGTNTNQINLSWNQSTGATGYKIYRNTSNSFSSGSLLLTTISSGSTTSYSDTGSATSSGTPPTTTYAPTLFRVDAAANDPFSTGQTSYLGSMYYNTTSGEFQCYKDSGVGGMWTDCGVTTLQGAYNNATSSSVPAIKLDSTHGTLNIQDADTTIGADLLNVRTSNSSGLGANMFGVGNTGTVTIQNPTDQNTSLRVLYGSGNYELNVNTATGYFITNTTRSLANGLQNPGFESGGNITSGEEGWNGPAQASIVNSSANAHGGNYELQVTPNATTLKTYAGTYYEVNQNDVIYFEGWVKNSAGANGTGGITIEGYDKDKALIGSSSDSGSLPGTSYIFKTASYTVPSNVKYVRVAAVVNSGASSGTYYFDDFYLTSSRRGQQLYQNTSDSTTAFRIQSASAAQTLFNADTTNNIVKIGDSTGTDTSTTIFQVDSATADPTTSLSSRNGGLYYRSDSGALKAIVGGAVVDVCTTAVVCSGYGASAGSVVSLQASTPGTVQTGNFNISGTGILTQLQTQDQSAASTNTSNLTVRTGNATGTTSNSGNLTLDVGTATGTLGTITIGHANVSTTMPGSLDIQGSSALKLGTSNTSTASILFRTSAGSNTITLQAPGSNPTSSWTLTLPQNPGSAGQCLKDSTGSGALAFGSCDPGAAVSLQDVYTNSSSPAQITLADGKDLQIIAQDTTTDPNVIINLQCTTSCGSNGRFAVQNGGTDVLTVKPNSGGIILAADTQIGSSTTDSTQINFHLDSYNGSSDTGTCSTTTNQGAIYYNTSMGSIRGCVNGSWGDISNPDTLGLLTFGIIPSSGATSGAYDLPSLVTPGVSGPCKVSWASSTSVTVQSCVAYSSGKRINVASVTLSTNSASAPNTNLTTTNRWAHVCIDATNGDARFTNTSGNSSPTANMPTFSISSPVVCLADVLGSNTSNGVISSIYDVRTFTSTIKEAVNTTTAAELGMLVDAGSSSLVPTATCTTGTCSGKLYGVIVATNGSTSSSTPNSIVASVGPAYVKATAGTAGQFIKSGPTSGYAETVTAIPNNAFYYSPGNTRTSWSNTCTAASNCLGSLYVNFIVR